MYNQFKTTYSNFKELKEQSKKINGGKWLETGVIITQPGGKTFYQLFGSLDAEEKRSVLFQVIYFK